MYFALIQSSLCWGSGRDADLLTAARYAQRGYFEERAEWATWLEGVPADKWVKPDETRVVITEITEDTGDIRHNEIGIYDVDADDAPLPITTVIWLSPHGVELRRKIIPQD